MFDYSNTENKEATNFWNQETTTTANGMPAFKSTRNALLDLFFKIGNSTNVTDEMVDLVRDAYVENRNGLMSVLLWARDCREGAGRRNVPRILLNKWFKRGNITEATASVVLYRLVELGRWDDVWAVALDTRYERGMALLIKTALAKNDRLCAKWLPRKGVVAAKLRKLLEMSPKQYRKTIVGITNVVETLICNEEFSKINYNHVPSQAMFKYTDLFNKKDFDHFMNYKDSLTKGTAKVNVKTAYPHQIVKNLWNDGALAEEQWKAKRRELTQLNTSFLPVIDVSGSMMCPSGANGVSCMDVAVSLGLMLAEVGNNAFNGRFITFSERPQLQDFRGFRTLQERVNFVKNSHWGFNTDIEAVFNLVLEAAISERMEYVDLPQYIFVISDMQFDQACSNYSAMKMIDKKFRAYGYKTPTIVFWNVSDNYENYPTVENRPGAILVSGFNTNLLEAIIKSPENITPQMFLDVVLENPRYKVIV